MNRFAKISLLLFVTFFGAVGGYFAVQKYFGRTPAPVELRDWRTQTLAGLTLEAPGTFATQPLNLGPAQEFVESSEMQVFKVAGFEIDVLRTAYKSGLELSFDGAVQGAVEGLTRLDGVRNVQQTASEVTVSGRPARRLSVTANRWRKSVRVEAVLLAEGQTFYQVQAVFDVTNPRAAADAERLLKSVRLGP